MATTGWNLLVRGRPTEVSVLASPQAVRAVLASGAPGVSDQAVLHLKGDQFSLRWAGLHGGRGYPVRLTGEIIALAAGTCVRYQVGFTPELRVLLWGWFVLGALIVVACCLAAAAAVVRAELLSAAMCTIPVAAVGATVLQLQRSRATADALEQWLMRKLDSMNGSRA